MRWQVHRAVPGPAPLPAQPNPILLPNDKSSHLYTSLRSHTAFLSTAHQHHPAARPFPHCRAALLDAPPSPPLYFTELAVASLTAYLAAAWLDRPRGWSRTDLLEVRASSVQGRGVFAKQPIPARTVLGAYPGRPRSPQQMAAKCEAAPNAGYYCFRNRHGRLLDPTDGSGQPSTAPAPGLPWFPVNATLSFVNEPPKGSSGPNTSVEDDENDSEGLIFVTMDEVPEGAELFIDYGLEYDRSAYALQQSGTLEDGETSEALENGKMR